MQTMASRAITSPLWSYCTRCTRQRLGPLPTLRAATRRHSAAPRREVAREMLAWQTSRYGSVSDLALTRAAVPCIRNPGDVLVEVHASSVNPIDHMLIGGYGAETLNKFRRLGCSGSEFPLTPGRDFSGVVTATGRGVPASQYKPGDEVWGAGEAWRPGAHAEYITIPASQISHKPRSVSHVEAASVPYVAATTWAGICTFGNLTPRSLISKRVLLLGGSGGLGTFAIQLLKAWGADVTVTCSADALDLVISLGADIALDYTSQDSHRELHDLYKSGYDLIIDGTTSGSDAYLHLLKPYSNAKYITFTSPFLRNNDELGLPFGLLKTGVTLGLNNIQALQEGKTVRYALFMPNGDAMSQVAKLVDADKIRPVVEKVYPFEELPNAYEKVIAKHNRGKTVVDMKG